MYLVPNPATPAPDDKDPETMRRRTMLATALGLSAAALPAWAEPAAATPDLDHTRHQGGWNESYTAARHELDYLAAHYVTEPGMTQHGSVRDSGLWLYAQAATLLKGAPHHRKGDARRLAAEAAAFAAGCYVDFGHMPAAAALYSLAGRIAGDAHPDLRVFISCQANWVPMYGGQWDTVLRRSETAAAEAERHGGYGLLMAYMHRAHAHAMFGNREAARADLATARANLLRVPAATTAPHSALVYTGTKVHFSSANVYAAISDHHQQAEAQYHALADPTLGWMDRQLMQISEATLDPDPEHAAHRIRFQLVTIPSDGFAYCVKADAQKALARLKARQLTSSRQKAGPEVRTLGAYLSTVKVA